MNLVDEFDRIADSHLGASYINVVFPTVYFIVISEGKVDSTILGLYQEAVWLQIYTIDIGDLRKKNSRARWVILGVEV